MGQPRITWGDIERYFSKRPGFLIYHRGGDKYIRGPVADGSGQTGFVCIGHKWSKSHGTEVLRKTVSEIKRVFGVNIEDLLD